MSRSSAERLARLRWTDRSLAVLLASLVGVVFVLPTMVSQGETPSLLVLIVFQTLFAVMLISGIIASTPNRPWAILASAVVAASILLFWIHYLAPSRELGAARAAANAVAAALITTFVLRQVFREGPITIQRIMGAVAAYLLIGLGWGNVYDFIEQVSPGSFRMAEPVTGPELVTALAYFSLVTLTTMGYGDITPIHPAARSAAVLEALVGQLFPAILIGRLVAMELSARQADKRQ